MMRPGTTPITGVRLRAGWSAMRKAAACTGFAFIEARPTGGTGWRASNSAGRTSLPPAITSATRHSRRLSSSAMSARQPGATSPRSDSPKMRAAEWLAAR